MEEWAGRAPGKRSGRAAGRFPAGKMETEAGTLFHKTVRWVMHITRQLILNVLQALCVVILVGSGIWASYSPAAAQSGGPYQTWLPVVMRAETNPVHSGIATYYDATGAGACGFGASPADLMVAAMNADEYDH